jgi:hypothetical protein
MLTSIRAALPILVHTLFGQDGSILVGTTKEWPSVQVVTTLLFILWAVGLVLLRRTWRVVQRHGGTDSVWSGGWIWISAIEIGVVVALFRVSILWYLTYLNWSGQESLSELPLVLLLFPEALAMSHKWTLTASNVWLLSTLLTVGSVTAALVVAAMVRTVWPQRNGV